MCFAGEFRLGELQQGTLFFGPRGRSRYKGGLSQCRAEGRGDVIPDRADDYVLQVGAMVSVSRGAASRAAL